MGVLPKNTYNTIAFSKTYLGTFNIPSRESVRFIQETVQWKSRDKEYHGLLCREMKFPILCSRYIEESPRDIYILNMVYIRSRIKILDVYQVPWLPICFYIGYMGLNVGMNKGEYEGHHKCPSSTTTMFFNANGSRSTITDQ